MRSCRSSSVPPLTASGTAWSDPRTARTSPAAPAIAATLRRTRSSRSCSTPTRRRSAARSPATATTCSVASQRLGVTSAGRRSSTSATAKSRTTRRSTPQSRAFCSPSRFPRSPPRPKPPRPCCRSETCCASSPGAFPPGRRSPARCGVQALGRYDLPDITAVYAPFGTSTPLWYYVLAEAKAMEAGCTSDRSADGSSPRR